MRRPPLAELASQTYELLVVGGGIVGCGIARDAALRGLRVALVERDDLGSGTTAYSTRLIHGGLRYLEQFDFGLVREDLREREILLRIAPHLVHPLRFLVPMYRWPRFERARLRAGLVLYDLLSYDRTLPGHRFLDAAETLSQEPGLEPSGLQCAASYFDAQAEFPERLCLENALDAVDHGAAVRTYTAVDHFPVEGGCVVGAEVRDVLTGERALIRARYVVNATGAWVDRALAGARPAAPPLLRTTRGVHLVTPPLARNALVLFARADRRLFFVVPWHGLSLIGTTDTDEPDPPELARADLTDADYLLEGARGALPALAGLRPYYAMAGVRALVRREGVHESQVSRGHALLDHRAEGGPAGLLSVLGGKITGYRAIAEQAVDRVVQLGRFGRAGRSTTARRPLPGAPTDPAALAGELAARSGPAGLDADQQQALIARYGRRALAVSEVLAADPTLAGRVDPDQPTSGAELLFAVRREGALTLTDVLLRRTALGLGSDQGRRAAARAAAILGSELGWGPADQADQVRRYCELLDRRYRLAASGSAAVGTGG